MDVAVYTDLPNPTSIRLLTLLPTVVTDRLECRLQVYQNLQDAPTYEALSYVWGSEVKNRPLVCNGADMRITESLDVALRRLRGRDSRVLWIDQICINQNNNEERSKQVQIMRDIFSSAQDVNIWLGEDSDRKAMAAKALLEKLMYLFIDFTSKGEAEILVCQGFQETASWSNWAFLSVPQRHGRIWNQCYISPILNEYGSFRKLA